MLYLLCFDRPLAHARHYIGWTKNERTLPLRIKHHRNGTGARLTQVIRERGIDFTVAKVWEGDRNEERRIKNMGRAPQICPNCREAALAHRRERQLAKRSA